MKKNVKKIYRNSEYNAILLICKHKMAGKVLSSLTLDIIPAISKL